jgi:hypothetical protein
MSQDRPGDRPPRQGRPGEGRSGEGRSGNPGARDSGAANGGGRGDRPREERQRARERAVRREAGPPRQAGGQRRPGAARVPRPPRAPGLSVRQAAGRGPAGSATAARMPFVLLVVTLLAGGLLSLLLLNGAVNQDSFELNKLQKETTGYTDEQQALQQEVDQYAAPGSLERRARELGMVPGGNPAFLDPDGSVKGSPQAATAPPAPPPASTAPTTPPATTPPVTTPAGPQATTSTAGARNAAHPGAPTPTPPSGR